MMENKEKSRKYDWKKERQDEEKRGQGKDKRRQSNKEKGNKEKGNKEKGRKEKGGKEKQSKEKQSKEDRWVNGNAVIRNGASSKKRRDTPGYAGGKDGLCLRKDNAGKRAAGNIAGQECPVEKRCGGCQYLHLTYEKQLALKQKEAERLLKPFCPVRPITGMENPFHYRNKVHAVFAHTKNGSIISGTYEEGTHDVVPVDDCLLENEKADAIIRTIRELLRSFKIKTYDEDTGYGLFRHVLIRTAHQTGQIMVVLVLGSPILPSKNNFVKALLRAHPEITTVVLNVNNKRTSMVLGEKESILYGKGYIEDILCGRRFRISARSFYQINSIQTESLYQKAMELAKLSGKERVIDAYCGIGTIGLVAAKKAGEVIGVELNKDAVRDAVRNAKANEVKNISFYENDAGRFMLGMAEAGEKADVVFMDPPRAGSDEAFLSSAIKLAPNRIVYISCNPETQARDLAYLTKHGYRAVEAWPFDLFPFTVHVETVALLTRKAR